MINEGFFKLPNRKKLPDVKKAIQDKGLPVVGKDTAILIALKRRLGKILREQKRAMRGISGLTKIKHLEKCDWPQSFLNL